MKSVWFVMGIVIVFALVALGVRAWFDLSVAGALAPATSQVQMPITQSELASTTVYDRRGVSFSLDSLDESLLWPAGTLVLDEQDTKVTHLTIDSELQVAVYRALETIALNKHYTGGAGVIMDVTNGELLALVTYATPPEDGVSVMRVTRGLYAPGSTIKPFLAVAALAEGIVDSETEILSTGAIELPNANSPSQPYVYHDWRAHGYVDMKKAIGVSSNVYFYAIGGGYEDQPGLGIERISEYLRLFGFAEPTGLLYITEESGAIPTPAWKAERYGDDEWRLGDTYLVSIGQHGYQVTPLQLARATAAIANGGVLPTPTVVQKQKYEPGRSVGIEHEYLAQVREGMEYAVFDGTASGLCLPNLIPAAKTGTAEVDDEKQYIHSWITGYFPYDDPRYVFTFMLERGPRGEEVGAVAVAHEVLAWISKHRAEYAVSP